MTLDIRLFNLACSTLSIAATNHVILDVLVIDFSRQYASLWYSIIPPVSYTHLTLPTNREV